MSETDLDQIRGLVDQLSFEDKLNLVEHLAKRLRQTPARVADTAAFLKPQDLYGIWRGQIPEDFDLDAALNDIRREWKNEWPRVFEK